MITYTIDRNFSVKNFMKHLQVDFIYSYRPETKSYYILDQTMYGEISRGIIEAQKSRNRIVIINNGTFKLEAYNIEQDELNEVFMKMNE